MSLALIHDKLYIKTFWEKRIDHHSQQSETEDNRLSQSALQKLRGEWAVRLESRTKHLKSFNDDMLRKAKLSQQSVQT